METTKYIIEIENAPITRLTADAADDVKIYKAKGFNSLVFDKPGLEKLTKYNEDIRSYSDGLSDAWRTVGRLAKYFDDKIPENIKEAVLLAFSYQSFDEILENRTPEEVDVILNEIDKHYIQFVPGDVVTMKISEKVECEGVVVSLVHDYKVWVLFPSSIFDAPQEVACELLGKTDKHTESLPFRLHHYTHFRKDE